MKDHRAKRIPLPGGRSIEAVWFPRPLPALRVAAGESVARGREDEERAELHRCPRCASELVYPVRWEERVAQRWRLELRCPNCEWRRRGEFAPAELARLDEALSDGEELLLENLRALLHADPWAGARAIGALRGEDAQPFDL